MSLTVRGNRSTQGKPRKARGEHANSIMSCLGPNVKYHTVSVGVGERRRIQLSQALILSCNLLYVNKQTERNVNSIYFTLTFYFRLGSVLRKLSGQFIYKAPDHNIRCLETLYRVGFHQAL